MRFSVLFVFLGVFKSLVGGVDGRVRAVRGHLLYLLGAVADDECSKYTF